MKYLLILLSLTMSTIISAQQFTIQDNTINFKDQRVQTVQVSLSPKADQVREQFESWMEDNYEVDLDGKKLLFFNKDYMSAKGVIIPSISSRKIDLIVTSEEGTEDNTFLNVFASFGYNNYITKNEYPLEYVEVRRIVKQFVAQYLPEYYYAKVEDTREDIADLAESEEDLRDDIKKNNAKIEELKKKNLKLAEQLDKTESDLLIKKDLLRKEKKEYREVEEKASKMKKK